MPPSPLSPAKRRLFALTLALGVLVGLEGFLALMGVLPAGDREDPFQGFSNQYPLFVPTGEGAQWTTAENKLRFFNAQTFVSPKPPGVQRVFCLGGSTTYGRPYDANTAFGAWLELILRDRQPNANWEVLNAGGISYASARIVLVMEEVLRHNPDAIILYTGHNEFLEERTHSSARAPHRLVVGLHRAARKTRLFSLLLPRGVKQPETQAPREVSTLLDQSVGPDAYRRDDTVREEILDAFVRNLREMAQRSRAADVPMVWVVPAANVRDFSPFRSTCEHPENEAWLRKLQGRAEEALQQHDPLTATGLAREILAREPRHAQAQYLLAESFRAAGRDDEASSHYLRALEEDIVPLRAPKAFSDAVRRVAAEERIPCIDFPALLAEELKARGEPALPGASVFLDHVHPTVEAHGWLAEALAAAICPGDVTAPLSAEDRERFHAIIRSRIDRAAEIRSLRNLAKVLSWAGKTRDAGRLAAKVVDLSPTDAEAWFILGLEAEERADSEGACAAYHRAVELDPEYVKARHNLALVQSRMGRHDEAVAGLHLVLQLQPDHPNARFNLGRALLRAGRASEARDRLRAVVQSDPEDAAAHELLGRASLELGDADAAARAFTAVLRLEPENGDAYFGRAQAWEAMGRLGEARMDYQEARELEPEWTAPAKALMRLTP